MRTLQAIDNSARKVCIVYVTKFDFFGLMVARIFGADCHGATAAARENSGQIHSEWACFEASADASTPSLCMSAVALHIVHSLFGVADSNAGNWSPNSLRSCCLT